MEVKVLNLNDIAKQITKYEGLKEEVNIAQVKEILRILFTEYGLEQLVRIYFKYNKG